jgi:hypothetical protein
MLAFLQLSGVLVNDITSHVASGSVFVFIISINRRIIERVIIPPSCQDI